jgi:hypothetical protein
MLTAHNNAGSFQLAPEGTHVARCYSIIDLGTHYSEKFKKSAHELRVSWELPTETMDDGRPFIISKRYTLSWHEKANLRKDMVAWRGKDFAGEEADAFDISKVVGAACMLQITHKEANGQMRARVSAIMALPKGTTCPPPVTPPFLFDLDNFTPEQFATLSEATREYIAQSDEYQAVNSPTANRPAPAPAGEDDIPW